MAGSVDEEALHQLYLWVDNIPLSRPKRNLSRDFSDGGVRSSVRVCVCDRRVSSSVCVCPRARLGVFCTSLCVYAFCPVCTGVRGVCAYMSLVLVAAEAGVGWWEGCLSPRTSVVEVCILGMWACVCPYYVYMFYPLCMWCVCVCLSL